MLTCFLFSEAAAFLFAESGHNIAAGAVLLLLAAWIYLRDLRESGDPVNLHGLFSLSFLGGEGLAALKLSSIGICWCPATWFTLTLAWAGFDLAYRGVGRMPRPESSSGDPGHPETGSVLFPAALLLAVSLAAFLVEAAYLGFVPLFVRGVPHAYSSFHLKGVHYLTVSCVLVPALGVVWFMNRRGRGEGKNAGGRKIDKAAVGMAVPVLLSLLIPVLCVSRFQLLFAVLLAGIVYFRMGGRLRPAQLLACAAALLLLLLVLTVARGHSASYLNSVFEMKDTRIPTFLSQPYIYIANNYENLDYLIRVLPAHTHGIRSLMPLWTFTGLKSVFPALSGTPLYFIKEELTTTTIIYDAWYDFGSIGVLIFTAALGAAGALLTRWCERGRNGVRFLFYAQFAAYMALSFFTSWFSLPVTWFYFGVTACLAAAAHFYLDFSRHRSYTGLM